MIFHNAYASSMVLCFSIFICFAGCSDGIGASKARHYDSRGFEFSKLDIQSVQMSNAISRSRDSVDDFIAICNSDEFLGADFWVKAYLEEDGVGYHAWLKVDRDYLYDEDALLHCELVDTPPAWRLLEVGQRFTQDPSLVFDWRIDYAGLMYGARTDRVRIERMDESDENYHASKLVGDFADGFPVK